MAPNKAQAVGLRGIKDQTFVQCCFYDGICRIIRQCQAPHQAMAAQVGDFLEGVVDGIQGRLLGFRLGAVGVAAHLEA